MQIIGIEPARASAVSARGFRTHCFFDAQITPDLRLYGLELVEAPNGKMLVYAPTARSSRRCATLSVQLGDELAELVLKVGVGSDRHDLAAA